MRRGLRTVVYDDTLPDASSEQLGAIDEVMPTPTPPMDNVMPAEPGMEDPRLRQIELADGGVVEREGFAEKGFVKNLSPQDRSRIANVDEIANAFKKAYEKDDISLLFRKTSINPNGILSDAAAINFSKNAKDPYYIKEIAKKLNINIEEVFDLIDERQNFYELDVQPLLSQQAKQKDIKLVNESIDKGENWLIKNSKNYDNVKDLKRGFKRIFGKDHPFLKNAYISEQGFTKFNNLFFPDIAKTYRESGNPAYTYSKKKLNNLFEASLYNFNPSVRTKVLNELESILPKKNPTQAEAYDLRKKFNNSKILKEFNINQRLDGPITRLLIKDLGENIINDINFVRYPRSSTKRFIKFMADKVSPQYKKQFNIISDAISDFEKNLLSEAKNKLKIVENINYEHRIPKSVIEQGYADEIEYAKITPVGEKFNMEIKNKQFDGPLSRLTRSYTAASSPEEKKKIVQKMNDLKDSFNKRYNNYLGDITIKETNGKLNFSSKAKTLKSSSDIMKNLENTIQKNPKLFQAFTNFGNKVAMGFDPTDVLKTLPEKEVEIMKKAMGKLGNFAKLGARGLQELVVGTGPVGIGITAALTVPFMIADLQEGKRVSEALQNQASALTLGLIPEADKRIITEIGGPEAATGFEIQQNIDNLKSLQDDLRETETRTSEDIMDPESELLQSNRVENIRRSIDKTFQDLLPYLDEQGNIIAPEYQSYLQAKNKLEQERTLRKSISDMKAYDSGFDDITGFLEKGPFSKDISKTEQYQKKLEEGYSANKNKPSINYIGMPLDDIINRNLAFAYGGRVNFKTGGDPKDKPILPINPMMDEGPQDPSKRGFLKGAGAVGLGTFLLGPGLLKLAKTFKTKEALNLIQHPAPGQPEWFAPLVEKILTKGTMNKVNVKELDDLYTYHTYKEGGQKITLKKSKYNPNDPSANNIDITVEGGGAYDQPFHVEYHYPVHKNVTPEGVMVPTKTKGSNSIFRVSESRPQWQRSGPDDYSLESTLEDFQAMTSKDDIFSLPKGSTGILSDVEGLEKIATGKVKNPKLQKTRQKVKEEVIDNPNEDRVIRYSDYDPSDYYE